MLNAKYAMYVTHTVRIGYGTGAMQQLVAVDEAGTMSGAAQRAHITQPSLSRTMQRLETDLGCELFDRARNSARLNEAGRIAAEHARDALDDLAGRSAPCASPQWRRHPCGT